MARIMLKAELQWWLTFSIFGDQSSAAALLALDNEEEGLLLGASSNRHAVSEADSHGRVMAAGQHSTRAPRATTSAAVAIPVRPPDARP